MKLGLALLRSIVGALFVGHGLQKLAGWFGGHGLEATGNAFESMGLRPGRVHATAAGLSEAGGGALLVLGLLTPVATMLISATMATAIYKVHAKNGPWAASGGYEYNLVLIAVVFALAELGPGELSLDAALGLERKGPGVALAQLGAALVGAGAAIAIGERMPESTASALEPDSASSAGNGDRASAEAPATT